MAVTVTPVNDAPVVAAGGGSLGYVENQAASAIDPALILTDLDDSVLASATVAITGNLRPAKIASSSPTRTASAAASMQPPVC